MLTESDIETLRFDAPGCGSGIHFNHSGASLPSKRTLQAIISQLEHEAERGPMEVMPSAQVAIDNTRALAARLLNADSDEIAFQSSGSAAWGLAFAALPALRPGDRLLVSRHEWGGNLATMRAAASRAGAAIEVIPCRDDGSVDADALQTCLTLASSSCR
jgi:cysteine desulfurase / selenocysteine lyase